MTAIPDRTPGGEKSEEDKRVSLHPLDFKEAVKALLATSPITEAEEEGSDGDA